MAKLDIEVGDYTYTLTFNVKDAFNSTTLGCHAGTFGAFYSTVQKKGNAFTALNEDNAKVLLENGLLRKVMEALVKGAATAFGGFDAKSGTGYVKKSHWIVSAPWNLGTRYDTSAPGEFKTPDIMDLIVQFCKHEPKKYGTCVLTEATDCSVHDNNSGKPCTRTLIWHPPYVGKSTEVLKTKVSGLVDALYAPKPKPEPKPKVVKPPRPVRKVYNIKKAQPKTHGPAPRVKYARAA
jgi:hypothetical protein